MDATTSNWIDQAAYPISRAYSPWTTFSDVKQQLWLFVTQNEERLAQYSAQPEAERIIRGILRQEARNYAVRERAAVSGYEFDDVAWYTVTGIKRILPDVFDYEDWENAIGGGASGRPAAWSGDKLASIIDVKKAVEKLPGDRQHLLRSHYANGISLTDYAEAYGVEYETVRKRHQRALKAISKELNDPRPIDPMEGVTYEEWLRAPHVYDTRSKGRRAMSNAAARSATEV